MSLFKIALLLSSSISTHIAGTNPNPPTKDAGEVSKYASSDVSIQAVAWVPSLMKAAYFIAMALETGGILCTRYPSYPISQRLLSLLPNATFQLSKQYLVGALMVIAGGYVRYKAYKALGKLFTFHLTIQNKHSLVTHGVYSWVRHPAYSGLIAFSVGVVLMACARGSLVAETGILKTRVGSGIMYTIFALLAVINWKFGGRLAVEDEVLQQQFGAEWDQWAAKVPYRLIPWVY